jgi:hypothetical protein
VLSARRAVRQRRLLCTESISPISDHGRAWNQNARIARSNPKSYFFQIEQAIAASKPKYFRWHVAGDILNTNYLHQMCRIAMKFPRTKFLAFTKAFNIVNEYEDKNRLPPNLAVVFSAWPRMSVDNRHEHRIAWMRDGTETRVLSDSVRCWAIATLALSVFRRADSVLISSSANTKT